MSKNKFNWDRFYDELEEADPAKFPFWTWFTHEMVALAGSIATGLLMGILFTFFILVFAGAMINQPVALQSQAKAFCFGLNSENSTSTQ